MGLGRDLGLGWRWIGEGDGLWRETGWGGRGSGKGEGFVG